MNPGFWKIARLTFVLPLAIAVLSGPGLSATLAADQSKEFVLNFLPSNRYPSMRIERRGDGWIFIGYPWINATHGPKIYNYFPNEQVAQVAQNPVTVSLPSIYPASKDLNAYRQIISEMLELAQMNGRILDYTPGDRSFDDLKAIVVAELTRAKAEPLRDIGPNQDTGPQAPKCQLAFQSNELTYQATFNMDVGSHRFFNIRVNGETGPGDELYGDYTGSLAVLVIRRPAADPMAIRFNPASNSLVAVAVGGLSRPFADGQVHCDQPLPVPRCVQYITGGFGYLGTIVRNPSPWIDRCSDDQPTRDALQAAILQSAEVTAQYADDPSGCRSRLQFLYEEFLYRDPSDEELSGVVEQCTLDASTLGQVAGAMVASPEYRMLHGLGSMPPAASLNRTDAIPPEMVEPAAPAQDVADANSPSATPPATTSGMPAPGAVLLTDDFPVARNASLPTGPVVNGFVRYLDGEYEIAKTGLGSPWPGVDLPGTYTDSSIAMDARFVNPASDVGLSIGCRVIGSRGYFARVQPQLRLAALVRYEGDPTTLTNLVPDTPQDVLQKDSATHIELRCAGPTLSLFLNGTLVATAQDATYDSGRHYIRAGVSTADARISHLIVTQQ